jgi:hypothetical protein
VIRPRRHTLVVGYLSLLAACRGEAPTAAQHARALQVAEHPWEACEGELNTVALAGETVVVGQQRARAAHVFVRNGATWSLQQTLEPGGSPGDDFGMATALSGDTALIGARGDAVSPGAAYTFVRSDTSWSLQQKLVPPDSTQWWFGERVALSGDTAAIAVGPGTCAVTPAPDASTTEAVYVFARSGTTWSLQQKLAGRGAALDGDTLLVGGPLSVAPWSTTPGQADVYVRSGSVWTKQQTLIGSSAIPIFNYGGLTLALDKDTALLEEGAQAAGAGLYVFARSGGLWTEQQKLAPRFGSLAVSGDTLLAGSTDVFVRSGTTWTLQQQLAPPGGGALDGDTVVVSTNHHLSCGAAAVFVRSGSTWALQQWLSDGPADNQAGASLALTPDRLDVLGTPGVKKGAGAVEGNGYWFTPLDAAAGDQLGTAVGREGSTLVAGAPGASAGKGAAYVADFVEPPGQAPHWQQHLKLVPTDTGAGDALGSAVAIGPDEVVAGAPGVDLYGLVDMGAVYVFDRNTGAQQAKLVPNDLGAGDRLGSSIGLDGDTIVVGAPLADPSGTIDAGAAYVFSSLAPGSWFQEQKLVAGDAAAGDRFGAAVAVRGDTVLVGAPLADPSSKLNAGAAYLFVRAGGVWTQKAKLVASDAAAGDLLGASVTLASNRLALGAPGATITGKSDAGAVYYFMQDSATATWQERQKVQASSAQAGARFGAATALHWDSSMGITTLLVGAPSFTVEGLGKMGAVYSYELTLGASGTACKGAEDCDSTICREGLCCPSFCEGVCNTCAGGQCVPRPPGEEVLGGAETCSATMACDGAGQCKKKLLNACASPGDCVSGFCAGGVCCTSECAVSACRTCASGACQDVPFGLDVVAGAQTCAGATSCDGKGGCKKKNAQSCTAGSECLSGVCVRGVCCGSACLGPCRSCETGTCTPLPAGTAVTWSPQETCAGSNVCNGNGGCRKRASESCSADGECVSERCSAGTCAAAELPTDAGAPARDRGAPVEEGCSCEVGGRAGAPGLVLPLLVLGLLRRRAARERRGRACRGSSSSRGARQGSGRARSARASRRRGGGSGQPRRGARAKGRAAPGAARRSAPRGAGGRGAGT